MNFFRYLELIPFLTKLVAFIREAQAKFNSPGSGPDKLSYVIGQFVPVVQAAVNAGLIPAKLGEAIVSGAGAITSIIVQLMNLTGGVKPAPIAGSEPPSADPTSIEYTTEDEAITHATPSNPLVFEKANGKFVIGNGAVGPLPGVQVYP